MPRHSLMTMSVIALAGTLIVAACGGSGSSSSLPPVQPPTPAPSSSPILTGTAQVATGGTFPNFTYAPAADSQVVFSCGCSTQAGTATTDNSGNFTLVANSTPTPAASPAPTYTVRPGRNYIVVATTSGGAEAWNTIFAGSKPSRNLYLNDNGTSDVYTAAVSLYVYRFSPNEGSGNPGTAFDNWNFYSLMTWYNTLKTTPNTKEQQLLNDIAAQSAQNRTLYPLPPSWNSKQATNPTILSDLNAVQSSDDPNIPSPCPTSGCTGTPSP